MKKRPQNSQQDHPAHPNWINYLALIHALTHPGGRDEVIHLPRKVHAAG